MWCACSRRAWAAAAALVVALLAACVGEGPKTGRARTATRQPTPPASPTPIARRWDLACEGRERLLQALAPRTAEEEALARAGVQVLCALRAHRWDLVADFVHPKAGLRFSPDAYLDDGDVWVAASALAGLPRDPAPQVWGMEAGSGRPIVLSFAAYAARYVYDGPYWEQGQAGLDVRRGPGNTVDNHAQVFPGSRVVEFHLPGSATYGGLDWRSLRLVFMPGAALPEGLPGTWCLVAIVHDAWEP